MRRRLLAIALSCLYGLLGNSAAAGDSPSPAVGAVAPDFESRDAVTHAPIHLAGQQGKVVVLTFWATWCAPCRKELPILENLQDKVGKEQLIVYAVPFRQPAETYGELVRAFRKWKVTLVDDRRGGIARQYGIKAIPHLFLIGRDGRIAAEHTGYGEGSVAQLVDDVNAAFRVSAPDAPSQGATPAPPH